MASRSIDLVRAKRKIINNNIIISKKTIFPMQYVLLSFFAVDLHDYSAVSYD